MRDDLVIFVKCNTAAEKRAFTRAAKARGKTLKGFALEAMAEKAGVAWLCPRQLHQSHAVLRAFGSRRPSVQNRLVLAGVQVV
jgi:hypothetical protein